MSDSHGLVGALDEHDAVASVAVDVAAPEAAAPRIACLSGSTPHVGRVADVERDIVEADVAPEIRTGRREERLALGLAAIAVEVVATRIDLGDEGDE